MEDLSQASRGNKVAMTSCVCKPAGVVQSFSLEMSLQGRGRHNKSVFKHMRSCFNVSIHRDMLLVTAAVHIELCSKIEMILADQSVKCCHFTQGQVNLAPRHTGQRHVPCRALLLAQPQ